MGFGLNVAPSIMQTIVDAILTKDRSIQQATSAYIDDVYVDESIVPAARVKEHLCSFGLLSKEPERLQMVHEYLGYRSGERITLCIGEEGTKSQTCLMSSCNETYFHYAANWVVGFVQLWCSSSGEHLTSPLDGMTKLMTPLSTP